MIKITKQGKYSKTNKMLYEFMHHSPFKIFGFGLDKYGKKGVQLLSEATPKDTGKTANSWTYNIDIKENKIKLTFSNTNLTKNNIPIAILIDYGHANSKGYYIQGKHFINKTIQPIFDEMAEELWKEVKNNGR